MLCITCNTNEIEYKNIQMCKRCYNKNYLKQYYRDNKEKLINYQHKYHESNKSIILERNKRYRESKQFNNKRQSILIRDNYTCAYCNEQLDNNELIIHHKDRLGRNSIVKNNDNDNLITLCRSCHIIEHSLELKKARKIKYSSRWANNYDCCVECQTTEIKHQSKGLCNNCYARHLTRLKNKDKPIYEWSSKYPYCIECHQTDSPHNGKGLCKICYEKHRTQRRKLQRNIKKEKI